jgi:hypothetical protein
MVQRQYAGLDLDLADAVNVALAGHVRLLRGYPGSSGRMNVRW